jgi:hypothetical protein
MDSLLFSQQGLDGIFRGKSFVSLVGSDLENNLVLKEESAHFLSFNRGSTRDYPSSLMGAVALIRQTLNDADWYSKSVQAYQLDPVQKRLRKMLRLQVYLILNLILLFLIQVIYNHYFVQIVC